MRCDESTVAKDEEARSLYCVRDTQRYLCVYEKRCDVWDLLSNILIPLASFLKGLGRRDQKRLPNLLLVVKIGR